jgi:hypothetical protein
MSAIAPLLGISGLVVLVLSFVESDPNVWSGRALQEGFVDLAFGQCALSPSFLPTNDAELESGFLALWETRSPRRHGRSN